MTGRGRYTKIAMPVPVIDSTGARKIMWPISGDLPTDLVINISPHGHIESVSCSYLADLGASTAHFLVKQRFFYRIFEETGVIAHFGYISPVLGGPDVYAEFLDLLYRMTDAVKQRTNSYAFKWKLIFSAEFILKEWEKAKEPLKRLLSDPLVG